jgi:hypothetical protein
MISIVGEAIHAFLSIFLHGYYRKTDQGDPSFFCENHPKEKYHYRRANDQDPLCAYTLIFFGCSISRRKER